MGNQWNKGHGWVVPSSFACYKPWSLFPEGDLRYGPKRAKTTMNPPHHRSYWAIQTCNDNKQKISNVWLHERITPSHFGWDMPERLLSEGGLLLVKFLGQNFWPKIWPKIFPFNFFSRIVHDYQRACWIEDIKLHIDNFCIVWDISIFLLTVAVYYAYMAGLEVWDLRNFSWFGV